MDGQLAALFYSIFVAVGAASAFLMFWAVGRP